MKQIQNDLRLILFFTILIFTGCTSIHSKSTSKETTLTIVNWNLQCFFDAETCGYEYSQFIKNKNWNKNAYETRLKRLCDAIKSINADIFVFEEIENQEILQDISNYLQGFSWNQKNSWKYGVFSKNHGSAIGSAVISKYPITESTVHNLYIITEKTNQPSMRPIIKIKIETDGDGEKLTLLVNHWKSKSGGEKSSENWRTYQEKLLASIISGSQSEKERFIACGDFNKNLNEFYIEGKNVLLGEKNIPVRSAWLDDNGTECENGSYFFKNRFEKIDHFFLSENVTLLQFEPLKGPWCTENGIPIRYEIFNGTGWSDHLPIFCKVKL